MSKFAIAFIAPADMGQLRHRILEATDQDTALRTFFSEEASELYSNDDQGFFYFKEDFLEGSAGSILPIE